MSGATIINGKGIGSGHTSFMGMGIDSEREVVLVDCCKQNRKKIANGN